MTVDPEDYEEEVRRKAERMARSRREHRSMWHVVGLAGAVGWQLVLPLVVGAIAGRGLAVLTDTRGLALAGIGLGLMAGLWSSWRAIRSAVEEELP